MIGTPIPEGLRRERLSRRTPSIDRLDQIIKMGGAVGEMLSLWDSDDKSSKRGSIRSDMDNITFDDLDLEMKADPGTYTLYGRLVNMECKEKGIPCPNPGGIDWAFRYTKDRVLTVNTLMYLLIQRRSAEQVILNLKKKIDSLQEAASIDEAKIKELSKVIAEKDEKIAELNPQKAIKRKTDAFNVRKGVFKQKEENFQKQREAFKKKDQQMEIELKRLTNDLVITMKAKTDVERKNKLIQTQKRNLENQYKKVQQRLKSKLDQVNKKSKSKSIISMRQIGEFPLLETEEEKRRRQLKDPKKILTDIVQKWNQNITTNFEEIKAENELLRYELEGLKQKQTTDLDDSEHSKFPQNMPIGNHLSQTDEENYSRQSVYDFYYDRLTEIFTEYVPESVAEIPQLLEKFREREHSIYEKVCSQFGIIPVQEYGGEVNRAVTISLTDANPGNFGLQRLSFKDLKCVVVDEKVPGHKPTNSLTSSPWLDDSGMDGMSVELDKGWSFAESISVVSPSVDGGLSPRFKPCELSPNKQSGRSPSFKPSRLSPIKQESKHHLSPYKLY
jgi:hypothetical protein